MTTEIQLFDLVELTVTIPKFNLCAGEIGTVTECCPGDIYEVSFSGRQSSVSIMLVADQLIPSQQQSIPTTNHLFSAMMSAD